MFVSTAVIIGLFTINFAWSQKNTPEPVVQDHPNMKLLPDDCGLITNDRLIYKKVASMYEFPWMALIAYDTESSRNFACTGTLINSQYILTAARCVDGSSKVAGVRIGEYDLRFPIDCENDMCEAFIQDRLVAETIVHDKFTGHPKYENDIALLRLHPSVDLNRRNAGTICLPVTQELRNSTLENKIGTVTGWGLSEVITGASNLYKENVPIRSMNDCKEFYSHISDPSSAQFCAGKLGQNSCKGDAGGPLIIGDHYKDSLKYVQFGIASKNPRQCSSESPTIYTDVRKYVDWILDHIRE